MQKIVQADLRGCVNSVNRALPKQLKYFVRSFWIVLIAILGFTGYNLVNLYALGKEIRTIEENGISIKNEITKLEAVDKELVLEKRSTRAIMQLLDCQYPVHKILFNAFKEKNQEVRFEKLKIQFMEGQPQLHICIDALGGTEALLKKCGDLSEVLSQLGFRSISVNQPWTAEGLSFDGLYVLPKRGGQS